MAKQRVVNTYFWSDDFILDLKADEKMLFLYVLTNPQTDLCGAYQIAMQKMVFETKLSEKRILAILDKFEQAGKVMYRKGWMVVQNFARHQVKNPKVAQGIARSLNDCPDWVKDSLLNGIRSVSKAVTPKLLPEPELKPEPTDVCVAGAQRVTDPLEEEKEFFQTTTDELCKRMGVVQLRDQNEWFETLAYAYQNKFSSEHVLEIYDLLKQQKWRKSRLTAKNVGDNLTELEALRIEIAEQENGSNASNSTTPHSGNGKDAISDTIGADNVTVL